MTLNQFLKHPLKEGFKNLNLKIKSVKRYFSDVSVGKLKQPPEGYSVVFEDDFSSGELDLNKWKRKPNFGPLHPSMVNQYYDTSGEFSYVKDSILKVGIGIKPKVFNKSDLPEYLRKDDLPVSFIRELAMGYVETREGFQYGWFEAEIKLPIGQYLWPAFWLSGTKTWPPEIDIFEAYTEDDFKYRKGKRFGWKIQPNLHYGSQEEGTKTMYGPFNSPVRYATSSFVHYACWWEKDFIRLYYNGYLVFECTNPDVLKYFNRDNNMSEQSLIINTAAHINGKPGKKTKYPTQSFMEVRKVRILQKNKNA